MTSEQDKPGAHREPFIQEQWIRLDKSQPGAPHGRHHPKLQGVELRQAGHLFRTATALCRSCLSSPGRSQQLQALAGGSIQVPPAMASQHHRVSPLQRELQSRLINALSCHYIIHVHLNPGADFTGSPAALPHSRLPGWAAERCESCSDTESLCCLFIPCPLEAAH